MNARTALPAVSALALSLLLSACGNKGPLVLPEPPEPVETPAEPGAVPVEVEPQTTMPKPETEGALRDPTSATPLLVDPVTGPTSPTDAPAEASTDAPVFDPIPIDPATVPDDDAEQPPDDGNG